MPEAFIRLVCPSCGESWEDNPVDLPAPPDRFECGSCGERRPTAEFMRTARDLEILEEFHA